LIYRVRTHRGHEGAWRGFGEADFAVLVDAAHQQLDSPIVVIEDHRLSRRLEAATKATGIDRQPALG
jgi:putative transposase